MKNIQYATILQLSNLVGIHSQHCGKIHMQCLAHIQNYKWGGCCLVQ
jgi:hypothetical protein